MRSSHVPRRRSRAVIGGAVLVAAAAAAVMAFLAFREPAPGGTILLVPRSAGADGAAGPFTRSMVDPATAVPRRLADHPDAVPRPEWSSPRIQTVDGGTPGLHGGTRGTSVCDRGRLVGALQELPRRAGAWGRALGVPADGIGRYVDELTSAVLRADTRVTDHGFARGDARARQAVLQRGTPVLVDRLGVPRVRCADGAPLLLPRAVRTNPSYAGDPWRGFDPGAVRVVRPAARPASVLVFVDVVTGSPFGRPVGSDGAEDQDALLAGVAGARRR